MKESTKRRVAMGCIAAGSVLLLFVLFFPIHARFDDGGTEQYSSLAGVYEITDWHKLSGIVEVDGTFKETLKTGITVELFGKTVYDNSRIE